MKQRSRGKPLKKCIANKPPENWKLAGGNNFPEPFGKGRKVGLLIFCTAIGIGNADTGIDPGFVDIKATAVVAKDFEHRIPSVKKLAGLAGTGHPAKSSQLRKR